MQCQGQAAQQGWQDPCELRVGNTPWERRGGTCRMVKFSRTLFIMYFSGRCLSLWMKLIMYSHMGDRWMR